MKNFSATSDGLRLNVIDKGTRECLAIEADTSLPAQRVVRVLEQLKSERGLPFQIRLDNGQSLLQPYYPIGVKRIPH